MHPPGPQGSGAPDDRLAEWLHCLTRDDGRLPVFLSVVTTADGRLLELVAWDADRYDAPARARGA